jgi:hypothetical protein
LASATLASATLASATLASVKIFLARVLVHREKNFLCVFWILVLRFLSWCVYWACRQFRRRNLKTKMQTTLDQTTKEIIHDYLHGKEGVIRVCITKNGDVTALVSWERGDGGPRPWWILLGTVESVLRDATGDYITLNT